MELPLQAVCPSGKDRLASSVALPELRLVVRMAPPVFMDDKMPGGCCFSCSSGQMPSYTRTQQSESHNGRPHTKNGSSDIGDIWICTKSECEMATPGHEHLARGIFIEKVCRAY